LKDAWQLCNNFTVLNKVTKVPAFPTGDLASKQSKMGGFHCMSALTWPQCTMLALSVSQTGHTRHFTLRTEESTHGYIPHSG